MIDTYVHQFPFQLLNFAAGGTNEIYDGWNRQLMAQPSPGVEFG